MTAYDAKDMARSFRTVRANTIKIAEEIPAEQYSYRAAPGSQSVAETLAHLAVSTTWPKDLHSSGATTVDFGKFRGAMQKLQEAQAALQTKEQILPALQANGEDFAAWLEGQSDEFLAERITFPAGMQPPSKSRFEMLLAAKEHEMHHRGQLMVVERLLGIVPHLTREFEARRAQFEAQAAGQKA